MQRKISTRAELIDALRVASELEHQLMAQYLFAVYSLKGQVSALVEHFFDIGVAKFQR